MAVIRYPLSLSYTLSSQHNKLPTFPCVSLKSAIRVQHFLGEFIVERELSESTYLQHSQNILKEAKAVLLQESREFYRCDPEEHLEGETYVQLTELLQVNKLLLLLCLCDYVRFWVIEIYCIILLTQIP